MKKIGLILITMFVLMGNVSASTNRLYFTSKNNRLYYDTDAFDENIFMNHYDMIPGYEYEDELIIENKTKETYDLYLKVSVEEQDELAEELIDNILMEVYLDDELIYSGTARGLDYQENGVDLQETILIGRYKANTESKLVVKTKLSSDYTNINNDSIGKITWEFYGRYGDEVSPILPETSDSIAKYVIMLSITSLLLILTVIVLTSKRKRTI